MTAIAADTFEGPTFRPWWSEFQAGLLATPAAIVQGADSYARFELSEGGVSGSHWFDDRDGYQMRQTVFGDFDVAAEIEVFNLAGNAVPAGGSARLFGIACHDPVRPSSPDGYDAPNYRYYHRMFGRAPGMSAGDAQPIGEWKYTRDNGAPPPDSLSTWDTIAHPGADPSSSTRGWVRVQRQGTTMRSWQADVTADGRPPPNGSPLWLEEHSVVMADLPAMVHVGPQIYAELGPGSADVSGHIYQIVPML